VFPLWVLHQCWTCLCCSFWGWFCYLWSGELACLARHLSSLHGTSGPVYWSLPELISCLAMFIRFVQVTCDITNYTFFLQIMNILMVFTWLWEYIYWMYKLGCILYGPLWGSNDLMDRFCKSSQFPLISSSEQILLPEKVVLNLPRSIFQTRS
jgi:hypothetical protein